MGVKCRRHEISLKCHRHVISIALNHRKQQRRRCGMFDNPRGVQLL